MIEKIEKRPRLRGVKKKVVLGKTTLDVEQTSEFKITRKRGRPSGSTMTRHDKKVSKSVFPMCYKNLKAPMDTTP